MRFLQKQWNKSNAISCGKDYNQRKEDCYRREI